MARAKGNIHGSGLDPKIQQQIKERRIIQQRVPVVSAFSGSTEILIPELEGEPAHTYEIAGRNIIFYLDGNGQHEIPKGVTYMCFPKWDGVSRKYLGEPKYR